MRFRYWLTHGSKKLREGLIWKTHVPILYKEKVKHTCVGCGYPPRGGLKLWYVSKAMPVGYEDMFSSSETTPPPNSSGAEVPASMPLSTEVEHTEDQQKSI
ncbi:hypothetical protein KCU95_g19788, partial [Aureobasidium melanogenum]